MKSSVIKSMFSIALITILALIYVHQQVELVKLSYIIDSKERRMEQLLDLNGNLGYTIKELENPSRLEKVLLAKNIDIAFPKKGHVVNALSAPSRAKMTEELRTIGLERKTAIFRIFEFLGLRAEAQAREK